MEVGWRLFSVCRTVQMVFDEKNHSRKLWRPRISPGALIGESIGESGKKCYKADFFRIVT